MFVVVDAISAWVMAFRGAVVVEEEEEEEEEERWLGSVAASRVPPRVPFPVPVPFPFPFDAWTAWAWASRTRGVL